MEQRGPSAWWSAALRGLGVALASTAVALLIGWGLIALTGVRDDSCRPDDLVCLPELGPLVFVVMLMPIVVGVAGPAFAYLFRLPRPWLFAIPLVWVVVLACVGTGPVDGTERWPFNDPVSSLAILWVPYVVIAVLVARRGAEAG